VFESIRQVGAFLGWLLPRFDELQSVVSTQTSHGKLIDLRTSIVGKEVYLLFEFTTGDAGGQNMVTIATQAICKWIEAGSPVAAQYWYIDGNMSGDKKATAQAFSYARGKKVIAEAVVPVRLVRRFLHTTPNQMFRYWQVSAMGGIQSGSIGIQGHYANGLAAMFIACGQDAACVSEAAIGMTRMDVTDDGDLYVSVSLPNLICGTVGGGTHLPTATECLEMIGCKGSGKARKFAEICAATVLCGELSIIGAMAAGDFAEAHASYGRAEN
jgi:hydroxymethylglutaryl-CoA reductase (NADPH)